MSFHGGHIGWSCCAGQHEELGEADTTAGLLLEAGGFFAWGQVAAEDQLDTVVGGRRSSAFPLSRR